MLTHSYALVSVVLVLTIQGQPSIMGSASECFDRGNISTHINVCEQHWESDRCNSLLEQIAETNTSICGSNREIFILQTQLQLKTNVIFSGLKDLTISGNPDPNINTTIACQQGVSAGLSFKNLTRLTLRQLTVTGCGALSSNKITFVSAITIHQCKDVEVERLIISKSTGIGLMIVDHQGGLVQMESSEFSENILLEDYVSNNTNDNIWGGGGVYIRLKNDPSEPVSFNFINCTFQKNVAHTRFYDSLYTDDLGRAITGHGLGGGVAIILEKCFPDTEILFFNCTFKSNEAFKGGGLVLNIEPTDDSEARNVSVRVESSLFEANGCNNKTVSGGGLQLNFASQDTTSTEVVIQGVQFKHNCAHFGGGVYFYSNIDKSSDYSNILSIEKCLFEGNKAHTGSAIDITPNVFQRLSNGTRTMPVFRDCRFFNNTIKVNLKESQTTYGIGTLYVSLYSIRFEGYNSFENNLGTAIHIVDGNFDMSQSSVRFYKNYGIHGGAVALIGESSMIVGPNKSYVFENNTALGKGGGLYVQLVDNHDITASKSCFIQYSDSNGYLTPTREWTANISFSGNRAKAGTGHAIFATSLYPCQTINNGTLKELDLINVSASNVFMDRGIIIKEELDEKQGHQVATEGAVLYNNRTLLRVIPGERFAHGVIIFDDLNHTAKVMLTVSIPKNTNVKVDPAFTSCVGEHIILKGKPLQVASLHLQTTSSRQSYTRLTVELLNCPPGFKFDDTKQECTCNSTKYTGLTKCDTTAFLSYMNAGFWAGQLPNKSELVTSFCPLKFCNYNGTDTTGSEVRLPQTHKDLNEAMCGRNRTGITCGNCSPDFTTHFHSPTFACYLVNPTLCKVGWLFYILSELVPVTVVFIAVIALNVSFTSGAVNGFIFFSQVLSSLNIDASGYITFSPPINFLTRGYQLIYGVFNFDMFQLESISFCLWPNASALDMLAIKYVTVVYALLLIVMVIWLVNSCHRIARCFSKYFRFSTIKTSVIHGISAFLVLCYSQCLKVSLSLLGGYHLAVREGSNLKVTKRVTLNGNIVHFSGEHLPYALPALLCLLTLGTFPPVVLLVYPVINKILAFFRLDDSRVVNFISFKIPLGRLKPLLDTFQGCFKDNFRFFAGLYFLYRWIPPLFDILLSSFNVFYAAVEVFIIVIFVLHSICQPYALKKHNIIDALLFTDLLLINIITFVHYYTFSTRAGRQKLTEYITPSAVVQLILIYLPLFVAMLYTVVLFCRLRNKQSKKSDLSKSISIPLGKLKDFVSSGREDDGFDNEVLPHRLIGGNVDYDCFEDTDRISYVSNETYSEKDIGATY